MRRLLFVTLLVAGPLFGAPKTTALTGRVTSGGRGVTGASVTAASTVLQRPRTTTTNATGRFWLEALPPGTYDVTLSGKGLQTLTRRVVIELGRVSRVEATLEVSEDEESVTSTATTIDVADTTAITTVRTADEIDRMPVRRDLFNATYTVPGPFDERRLQEIDEVPWFSNTDIGGEPFDQLTVFRAALPVESRAFGPHQVDVRTRSGGEQLTVSVRDTLSSGDWTAERHPFIVQDGGVEHYLESSSGGRVLPERLWFFAAGWAGDYGESPFYENIDGYEVKLTGALGRQQTVVAEHVKGSIDYYPGIRLREQLTALSHIAQFGASLTTQVVAARSASTSTVLREPAPVEPGTDTVSGKATLFAAGHLVSAGFDSNTGRFGDTRGVFLNDRWWLSRWTIEAGARMDDWSVHNVVSPRLALTYDVRGDGRRAVLGAFRRYALQDGSELDELALGYAAALGASGRMRVDAIRRHTDQTSGLSLVADAGYRLFDRLELGGNYTWTDYEESFLTPVVPNHVFNAWVSADWPIGSQTLGGTVVERYSSAPVPAVLHYTTVLSTDAMLRYTRPVGRTALTLAAEGENLFNHAPYETQLPRTFRLWARVRL